MGGISEEIAFEINDINLKEPFLPPFRSSGFNTQFNGDGLLRVDSDEQHKVNAYLQLFRNGIIESVNSQMLKGRGMRQDGLPSQPFATSLGSFVSQAVKFFHALNIDPPACLLTSLINVNGASLLQPASAGYYARAFDRDDIFLPAIVIEDFNSDPKNLLRPALDILWQHAGEDGCPYFLTDGTWNLRTF